MIYKDLSILEEVKDYPELEALIKLFEDGENIFLNGQAGTGKSYLLKKFLKWLDVKEKVYSLAGSTGVAAINVGGTTLHRMLGIGLSNSREEFVDNLKSEVWLRNVHKKRMLELMESDIIIIDEISMVSDSMLELMDFTLRSATGFDEPFGGMQIMFTGDFYQLPPVKGDYAFMSPSWKEKGFRPLTLTKVKRQDDAEFVSVLNKIRKGIVDIEVEQFLESKVHNEPVDSSATKLYSRNVSVDKENESMLANLEGKAKVYKGEMDGDQKLASGLAKQINSNIELELKVGVKVMSMVNDAELAYVNGSIGTVVKMSSNGVIVEFEDGYRDLIEPFTWYSKDAKGNILAAYTQIPLKLAYAITIHKSQGMTIDGELFVDCDGITQNGQFYVALSRVRDSKKLKIINYNRNLIKTSGNVLQYFS